MDQAGIGCLFKSPSCGGAGAGAYLMLQYFPPFPKLVTTSVWASGSNVVRQASLVILSPPNGEGTRSCCRVNGFPVITEQKGREVGSLHPSVLEAAFSGSLWAVEFVPCDLEATSKSRTPLPDIRTPKNCTCNHGPTTEA